MRRLVAGFVLGALTVSGFHAVQAQRVSAPSPYLRFVGVWLYHGGAIKIAASGYSSVHTRSYVNCAGTITTDCDKRFGNKIYTGGFIGFSLSKTQGTTATGRVYNSSESWQIGWPATVTLNSNGTLSVRTIGYNRFGCNAVALAKAVCGA